jgi:hypothetical protein
MTGRRRIGAFAHDQRGAVMLIGLFMAVFLVALLYYVVGIAEAIAQRERMQDAADAAALSAASLLARAMNAIALTNMVMAALLAILVALKLVETLAAIAIVLIAALAFLAPGLASYIPGLEQVRSDVRTVHDELEPPIHSALETLHAIARGIRVLAPAAAQLRAAELVREHYRPPAEFGFVLPPLQAALPTEDGSFAQVCDRATAYTGDLVSLSLAPLVPDAVADLVGDATADLLSDGGTWFCGEGAKSPHTKIEFDRNLPILPSRAACNDYSTADADYDAHEHAKLCGRAETDEAAAQPDDATGACTRDCRNDGPYAQRAALAREQCLPNGTRKLRRFEWVQRRIERRYEFRHGVWRVTHSDVVPHSAQRIVRDSPPCGAAVHAIAREWTSQMRAPDGAHQSLCSDERAPQQHGIEGAQYGPVRFTEVVDLLGCIENAKVSRRIERDEQSQRASRDAETPQRIADGARLGEARFQVRAVVLGKPPSRVAERLVDLARWASSAPAPEIAFAASARNAARAAFAQAEYYYAVEDPDRDESAGYLWNMRWQARFRRFRAADRDSHDAESTDDADTADAARFGVEPMPNDARSACIDSGAREPACDQVSDAITETTDLLIH